MNKAELIQQIRNKKSYLCVGLDTDLDKIPAHLLDREDPIFEFNKQIIDATRDYCVAYKPNVAFYEAYGAKGWMSLEKTVSAKHILPLLMPNVVILVIPRRDMRKLFSKTCHLIP